ncbi:MAG TPA: hypothetical protein DIT08_12590 [Enterococcus sp.]|nr:hypothetical protein [Enterococcus sp.]
MFFIGFYQVPVLIKVSEKCFTNVATRRARHRVGTFFFCEFHSMFLVHIKCEPIIDFLSRKSRIILWVDIL